MLETTGQTGQEHIEMIVRGDLSEAILNKKNVAIWYAFRGEARNRAAIAAFSDTRDAKLRKLIFNAFARIAKETEIEHPNQVARDATHGTLAMLEGMWTDYLLHPDSFDRDEAMRIVFRFLRAMFPKHFDLSGARLYQ
ncbi:MULTISPECIES: TetR family transcriptional regulator C-terminal domain-containing protein [Ruegeria]|nr:MULTISPECIES: TetR family transcriptional regulator C-terminal domain-containing protein [Ruegeria]